MSSRTRNTQDPPGTSQPQEVESLPGLSFQPLQPIGEVPSVPSLASVLAAGDHDYTRTVSPEFQEGDLNEEDVAKLMEMTALVNPEIAAYVTANETEVTEEAWHAISHLIRSISHQKSRTKLSRFRTKF